MFFAALGFALLGLGAVGIAVPVLPTTPFVLLASLCFSASGGRCSRWLRGNRFFGPYIENYRTGQGVKASLKLASIVFLWAGLILSMLAMRAIWGYAALGAVGIGVTIHLLSIKTKR